MNEQMRSSEPDGGEDDLLRKLERSLAELRAAAAAPAEPESWTQRAFRSSSGAARQNEFNRALIGAWEETVDILRAIAANQETQGTRLEKIAQQMSEARGLADNLDAFRERADRLEAELRSAAKNVKALQERAAASEAELATAREESAAQERKLGDETRDRIAQLGSETAQRIEQLGSETRQRIEERGNEMRERIQHVLDEQRVCIRQLSLQASEEAVLADRARKAVELKLEELARRLGPPPA